MTVHLKLPTHDYLFCCNTEPEDLPFWDRVTQNQDEVTCDKIFNFQPVAPLRAPDLAIELGITYRQLDYWIRVGYLEVPDCGGSGNQREIPDLEAVIARIMVRLIGAGLTVSAAAVAARRMVLSRDTVSTLPNDVIIILLPERKPDASGGNQEAPLPS